jgi:hypothetical protein
LEKGEEPWLVERGIHHKTFPGEDRQELSQAAAQMVFEGLEPLVIGSWLPLHFLVSERGKIVLILTCLCHVISPDTTLLL